MVALGGEEGRRGGDGMRKLDAGEDGGGELLHTPRTTNTREIDCIVRVAASGALPLRCQPSILGTNYLKSRSKRWGARRLPACDVPPYRSLLQCGCTCLHPREVRPAKTSTTRPSPKPGLPGFVPTSIVLHPPLPDSFSHQNPTGRKSAWSNHGCLVACSITATG